jgi:dTDP-4-dehydrorhamnose reductase
VEYLAGGFQVIKLLIFGATGMLGSAAAKHFLALGDFETVLTARDENNFFPGAKTVLFDAAKPDFDALPVADYIINCIGIIKPFMAKNLIAARYVNAVFPWQLATWAKSKDAKLFHITTDCVFSGRKGRYDENDLHDALDDYGKSKSLGEPASECMVIRTSIIGEEVRNNASLVEWAKSQKGRKVGGYINHFWNGITTNWYAKICEKIIRGGLWEAGLFHAHASDIVSKYQMMQYFDKRFGLGLKINPTMAKESCDRSLASIKGLCAELEIPSVGKMIEDM